MIAFLPDCPNPNCGEDELYRVPGKATQVRCAECGWSSGILSEEPVLPSEAAALVAKAASEYKAAKEAK